MIVFPQTPEAIPTSQDAGSMIIYAKHKAGKTTILSLLRNNLILDFEKGTSFVGGLKMKVNSYEHFLEIMKEFKAQGVMYDFITIDTTTQFEEFSKEFAKKLYQQTPMGENWGKPDKKTGKIKPGQDDITKLPNGAGYLYLRQAFIKMVDALKPYVRVCLILSGHVADKMVNKDGEEISQLTLDLTGKLASIIQSKVDAVGLLYRDDNKAYLTFVGGGNATVGARPQHLSEKQFLISEKDMETEVVTTHWEEVFLSLTKDDKE